MTAVLAERRAPVRPDIFGASRLGYVVIESQRLTDWHRFGADAIGLHVDELTRDALRLPASTTASAGC